MNLRRVVLTPTSVYGNSGRDITPPITWLSLSSPEVINPRSVEETYWSLNTWMGMYGLKASVCYILIQIQPIAPRSPPAFRSVRTRLFGGPKQSCLCKRESNNVAQTKPYTYYFSKATHCFRRMEERGVKYHRLFSRITDCTFLRMNT